MSLSTSLPTKSELYNYYNKANNQSDTITLNIHNHNNIAKLNEPETSYNFNNNIYEPNVSNINSEIVNNSNLTTNPYPEFIKNQSTNMIGFDNVRNYEAGLPPYGTNINQTPYDNYNNLVNNNYNQNKLINNQVNHPVEVKNNKSDDEIVEVEVDFPLRCLSILTMICCFPCICSLYCCNDSDKRVCFCEQFGRLCCCEKILVRRKDVNKPGFHYKDNNKA